MTGKYILSKNTFDSLINHLSHMKSHKNRIVDKYYSRPDLNRTEFQKFLDKYINKIYHLIENSNKSKDGKNSLPIVVIGSRVQVEDLKIYKNFEFKLIPPDNSNDKTKNAFNISFLSPTGRSLLLKKVGDEINVKAPGGIFSYKIKEILFP